MFFYKDECQHFLNDRKINKNKKTFVFFITFFWNRKSKNPLLEHEKNLFKKNIICNIYLFSHLKPKQSETILNRIWIKVWCIKKSFNEAGFRCFSYPNSFYTRCIYIHFLLVVHILSGFRFNTNSMSHFKLSPKWRI